MLENQVTAEESVPLVVLLSTIISISVVDMLGTTIPSPPKISRTNFKGKPNRNEWGKSLILHPHLFSAWYSSLKFFCVQIVCSSSVLCSCNTTLLSLVRRPQAVTWPGLTLNFQMDSVHSCPSQHTEHMLEFHHFSQFVAWLWKWMLLTRNTWHSFTLQDLL